MIIADHQHKTAVQRTERCALCARKLKNPGTVVPALGVVGPECERHVSDALAYLAMNGLEALILTGEMRIPMERGVGGTLTYPQAARDLQAAGRRVGLEIAGRIETGTTPSWVARLKDPKQLLAILKGRAA